MNSHRFAKFAFLILTAIILRSNAGAETVIEPDDSQTPACYVGKDANRALHDLLASDLYTTPFSDALSYVEETNVIGIQVGRNGRQKVTLIPPCSP